jgi:hypothetical protein
MMQKMAGHELGLMHQKWAIKNSLFHPTSVKVLLII